MTHTQYTMLLLELEQIDKHLQKTRKENDHDDRTQNTSHRPVHVGRHGDATTTEDGEKAA